MTSLFLPASIVQVWKLPFCKQRTAHFVIRLVYIVSSITNDLMCNWSVTVRRVKFLYFFSIFFVRQLFIDVGCCSNSLRPSTKFLSYNTYFPLQQSPQFDHYQIVENKLTTYTTKQLHCNWTFPTTDCNPVEIRTSIPLQEIINPPPQIATKLISSHTSQT